MIIVVSRHFSLISSLKKRGCHAVEIYSLKSHHKNNMAVAKKKVAKKVVKKVVKKVAAKKVAKKVVKKVAAKKATKKVVKKAVKKAPARKK